MRSTRKLPNGWSFEIPFLPLALLLMVGCGAHHLGGYRYVHVPSAPEDAETVAARFYRALGAGAQKTLVQFGLRPIGPAEIATLDAVGREQLLICSVQLRMGKDSVGVTERGEVPDQTTGGLTEPLFTMKDDSNINKTVVRIFIKNVAGETVYKGRGEYVGSDLDLEAAIEGALKEFGERYRAERRVSEQSVQD